MAYDHPMPADDDKHYGCTRLLDDVIWWTIVGYHVYMILRGMNPYGCII